MVKGISTGHDQEPADGRLEIVTAQEKKFTQASHVSSLHWQKQSEERSSKVLP